MYYACAYSLGLLYLLTVLWKLQPPYTENHNNEKMTIHMFLLHCYLEALLYNQNLFSNTNFAVENCFPRSLFFTYFEKTKQKKNIFNLTAFLLKIKFKDPPLINPFSVTESLLPNVLKEQPMVSESCSLIIG